MKKNNQTVNALVSKQCIIVISLLILSVVSYAQNDLFNKARGRLGGIGSSRSGANTKSGSDSTMGFEHRDDAADSISISYRFMDSLKADRIDSSLYDFNRFFSVPANYIT